MAGSSWLPFASPANPRLVEADSSSHAIWRSKCGLRQVRERPCEVVNSIKEKRATDPILKFSANTRHIRDIYGKDSSHRRIEKRVKGEQFLIEDESIDPREYIMGPEEGAEPRRTRRKPREIERKGGYKNPTGRVNSKDPVPPPLLYMPYITLEDVTWSEEDEEWHQLPDISPDEVLEKLTVDERTPRGVDLSQIETSTEEMTLSITRSGYCSVFEGVVDDHVELEVTATNDYRECERWAGEVIMEGLEILGMEAFTGFINELPPYPYKDCMGNTGVKPKHRFEPKAAMPPLEGPVLLKDRDKSIYALCISTDKKAIVIQLEQMRVIGPNLRALLEGICLKCCRTCDQVVDQLRQDGVMVYNTRDVCEHTFLGKFKEKVIRSKVREVCRRAGHFTWLKSMSGVTIEEPYELYPYMWGELKLSEDMVKYAAQRAYANFVVATMMSVVHPSDMVGLKPKEATDEDDQVEEEFGADEEQPDEDDSPGLPHSGISEFRTTSRSLAGSAR